jgi:hypothetical protein
MDELLLYIRLEDDIVVDDGVAQIVGAADKHALVTRGDLAPYSRRMFARRYSRASPWMP